MGRDRPFGVALTFKQLLRNLQHLCHCTVVKLDDGGIPDTDDSVSGALYEVTRIEGYAQWYAHVEVFHENLPVLPDHLESICIQLNLSPERVIGDRLH